MDTGSAISAEPNPPRSTIARIFDAVQGKICPAHLSSNLRRQATQSENAAFCAVIF